MNERRLRLVQQVFSILDRDQSGIIELIDIQGMYNAKAHPDVIGERKTEEEVLQQFLETFEGSPSYLKRSSGNTNNKNRYDGRVTPGEFIEYYQNISASIDSDDYFELMIRNAWHIAGGEGWCANTTNRRILVTHEDGRQTVEMLEKDLGMKKDDFTGMARQLQAQGLTSMKTLNINGIEDMKSNIAVDQLLARNGAGNGKTNHTGNSQSNTPRAGNATQQQPQAQQQQQQQAQQPPPSRSNSRSQIQINSQNSSLRGKQNGLFFCCFIR